MNRCLIRLAAALATACVTAPAGRAAAFATAVLETSGRLDDEEFVELIHPWEVEGARRLMERDA